MDSQLLSILGDTVRNLPFLAFALYIWWQERTARIQTQEKYELVLLKIANLSIDK